MNKFFIIVLAVGLGAATAWLVTSERVVENDGEMVVCTADALMCPDGSAVGREGSECEFAACPAEPVPEDVQDQIDAMSDEIVLDTPLAGSYIASPLRISGAARGIWLNEGDFPVLLTDWNGEIVAEHYLSAEGDWMTEEFVPFSGELEFVSPYEPGLEVSERGWLILQRDNPSGLSEHDAAVEIPVWFTPVEDR